MQYGWAAARRYWKLPGPPAKRPTIRIVPLMLRPLAWPRSGPASRFSRIGIVLLRQEIASYGVTVRATLRVHFLGETGHERGPAGTVRGLCRGTRRGDWACGSGRAIAWLLPGLAAAGRP